MGTDPVWGVSPFVGGRLTCLMIADLFFYLAAVPAVLIVGISKGGFGGGLAVVAVPLMSLAIAPPQAAGIMLPVLCVMDIFGVWVYRHTWDRRLIALMLPAGILGIALGTLSFRTLDDTAIRVMVGVLALFFAANAVLRRGGKETAARPKSHWLSVPVGVFSGFTSFVAHAGGPPVTAYFLALRLEKVVFVSTSVIFFTSVNYLKLIPYGWLGQLNPGNLTTSVILAPLAVIGVALGAWLNRRISDALFRHLVHVLLVLTGLKLVADGIGAS